MPNKTHPFALALAFAALTTGTCLAAGFVRALLDPVPGMPIVAAMLLALDAIVLVRVGRWALGARGGTATALALAGLSAPLVIPPLYTLSDPIVSNHWRCGTGEMMLLMMVPPALFVVGTLTSLLALPALRGEAYLVERRMRALAILGVIASAVLVIASAARAARHPGPDGYVASLPVVARVRAAPVDPEAGARHVEGVEREPGTQHDVPRQFRVYGDAVGPAELRRTCFDRSCQVRLVRPDWREGLDDLVAAPATSSFPVPYGDVPEDALVEVRHDVVNDVWVVSANHVQTRSYRGPSMAVSDVHAPDVARVLSPPRGWVAGAAGGLVLAGALMVARRRPLARRRVALAGGRAGTLDASGTIRFDGGEPPVRAAPGQSLVPGPVVVLPGELSPGGLYRGDGSWQGARVVCGEKDALLAAADEAMARLDALSFAACALSGAPLVAATIVGLVL